MRFFVLKALFTTMLYPSDIPDIHRKGVSAAVYETSAA